MTRAVVGNNPPEFSPRKAGEDGGKSQLKVLCKNGLGNPGLVVQKHVGNRKGRGKKNRTKFFREGGEKKQVNSRKKNTPILPSRAEGNKDLQGRENHSGLKR